MAKHKTKVKVEFSKSEIQDICHALLMTSSEYLRQGSENRGAYINYKNLNALYDKISPLRDGMKD